LILWITENGLRTCTREGARSLDAACGRASLALPLGTFLPQFIMEQFKEFNASSDDEDTCEFTCCDCNETLTDNLMGYHSEERCSCCEAELIEIGLFVKNSQIKE
jgi:hypothetical protein